MLLLLCLFLSRSQRNDVVKSEVVSTNNECGMFASLDRLSKHNYKRRYNGDQKHHDTTAVSRCVCRELELRRCGLEYLRLLDGRQASQTFR